MSSRPPPPEPRANVALSSAEHIRDTALSMFAAHGTAGTSLRAVAAAAGVSLGRVQHHFGTKARLIKAVDDHVLDLLRTELPEHEPEPSADPVGRFGDRVVRLVSEHADILEYLVRAIVEGNEFGSVVFDDLVTRGQARWESLKTRRIARADVDVTWAAINPVILTLGAILLRPHIERQLPESLYTPTQLQRWEQAVSSLMHEGQLRRTDNDAP